MSSDDNLLKTSSIDYPDNHQVKQCVPNTIAISEYGRNRGSSNSDLPSIDGILYIQKNIANEENGLRLTREQIIELVDYFVVYNIGVRETSGHEEGKRLVNKLKGISAFRNLDIDVDSNSAIATRKDKIAKYKDWWISKFNSNANSNDKIFVPDWNDSTMKGHIATYIKDY